MKKLRITSLLILISLALTLHGSLLASGDVSIGDWLCYNVTSSSGTLNSFYGAWPPGHYYGNWSVSVGDLIWFNVTAVSEESINGTLKLGSYTFSNVRNIDAASALVLSVYPWYGGFFTNTSNLLSNKSTFLERNTTITVTNSSQTINNNDLTLSVIIIKTINYYGQNSTLYYSLDSGILLNATTSFGGYMLGLELVKTNIIITTKTNSTFLNFLVVLISIFVFSKKRWKLTS